MNAREFLEKYFTTKQRHELDWEETWQRELRPFFGEYFLDRRQDADVHWATIPNIMRSIDENDDTVSFITEGEGHHTKRYYVTNLGDRFAIDRIMVQCDFCEGKGKLDDEECIMCSGRGWDDWLD
jgi:hypothetical protein